MNNRRSYFAQAGLAGFLILAGTCWVSGQQGRLGGTYRPQEDLGGPEFRGETRYERMVEPAGQLMPGQRATAVVGSCVKLPDGHVVGRIEDLMINEDGCVDFMVVSFNGTSEFGGRLAALPWSVGDMDFGTRMVTLNVEPDRLREAPVFFTRGRAWPNLYEPQWAATVHNYFGIESDIERRIERAYGTPDDLEPRPADRDAQPRREPNRRSMRDVEPQGGVQPPRDKHLDPKPAPDSGLNQNRERTERLDRENQGPDSIRNNRDDLDQDKDDSDDQIQ